ncbi:glucans biosynthesis protein [Aliiruegeria lutimaris]|uniref:Glucans biosynthesis protein n=2 Tax=Aliiruegeria lutimaris TaxID=571298 RepID=A0A1G9FHU2_9RHOB|nr:glucans biosynthesis protein [Aliiruegeria lutimaris]
MISETKVFCDVAPRMRPTRRQALCTVAAAALMAAGRPIGAQEATLALTPAEPAPFSFVWLSERMRTASAAPYQPPLKIDGPLSKLDYDDFRSIRFRPDHARWADEGTPFTLQAFHLGWLFEHPVRIHELIGGETRALDFTPADFTYDHGLEERIPGDFTMPGVAGFRIHTPLNRPDVYDEMVVFLGASYFRALGRGTLYGLSARGLAINTGIGGPEEFPRFTEFWIERPRPGDESLVLYAALESPSVTGAYRFELFPGETTRVDVTARLFFRAAVEQVGIAPLTSMFLFGPNDAGAFDDYRRRVHDSEMLVLETGGQHYVRPLNNPPRLANSYLGAESPTSFGLVQRNRDFRDYFDAGAHYERRPSLIVEPLGEWGKGTVRLVEIPSDLEANDNIVAFWVPGEPVAAGDELDLSYRLHWGLDPPGAAPEKGHVVRTLSGHGGVAGLEPRTDRRKFAIDFEGVSLAEHFEEERVEPRVIASGAEVNDPVLFRIDGTDSWRLVFEIEASPDKLVELLAAIVVDDRTVTENWLYQWIGGE